MREILSPYPNSVRKNRRTTAYIHVLRHNIYLRPHDVDHRMATANIRAELLLITRRLITNKIVHATLEHLRLMPTIQLPKEPDSVEHPSHLLASWTNPDPFAFAENSRLLPRPRRPKGTNQVSRS